MTSRSCPRLLPRPDHHPGLADGAWQLNLRARRRGLKVSRALEGRNWLTRKVACLSGGC